MEILVRYAVQITLICVTILASVTVLSRPSDPVRNGADRVSLHIVQLQSAVNVLVYLSHHADVVAPHDVEPQDDLLHALAGTVDPLVSFVQYQVDCLVKALPRNSINLALTLPSLTFNVPTKFLPSAVMTETGLLT